MAGVAGEEADWRPQNRSFYPLDYYNLPLLRSPFGEHYTGHKYPYIVCPF